MIDPLTALSVAASAVSNAKTLLAAGRDATSALSKFGGAYSDLNWAVERSKSPSIWKSLTGSAEAEAIELYSAQVKMRQMKKDVEQIIMYTQGPQGVEEYKRTLREVRAQRKKNEHRRAEIQEAMLTWTIGVLATFAGLAGLAIIVYAIGKSQNRW